MKPGTYLLSATALTACGSAFSGYLSAVKALRGQCAFNDPCPLFLGRPACYFGCALFVSMFAVSAISLAIRVQSKWPAIINSIIAVIGVLFALRMTLLELVGSSMNRYAMGLPTCAYGLVFFCAIGILSIWALRARHTVDSQSMPFGPHITRA